MTEMTTKGSADQDINSNVVSEIDETGGTYVRLGSAKLPKIEGQDEILSTEWSPLPKRDLSAAGSTFESGFINAGADKTTPASNGLAIADQAGSTPAHDPAVDTSRSRIDQAIQGEEKKGINPRIIKIGVAMLVTVAVVAFVIVGMSGEKRKSLLGKNKQSENSNEQTTAETSRSDSASAADSTDRRKERLEFGDVRVGNDPKNAAGENDGSGTPESTEEARKTENVEPSLTPTPAPAGYPFNNGYGGSAGQNQGAGSPPAQPPATTETAGGRSQNSPKSNRTDLSETSLGLETDDDRFRVVLRAGQSNTKNSNSVQETPAQAPADTVETAAVLPRGTKLELTLDEPIRSGIATAVTGKMKKGVVNKNGEIIIPKDSMVVVQFSAEVVNGRVFNEKQAPIQIVTPDGRSFEVKGMVKDGAGFAGLTGKITKVGGRSTFSKIGGVLSRVGTTLPGGSIITGAQQGIESGSGGDYITNAAQIVEVPRGTSFIVIVGY